VHALPRKETKAFTERAREPQHVGIYTGLFLPNSTAHPFQASEGEVSPSYGLLDLTVYGRQETWEDSPAGWPHRWAGLVNYC
jgi:hypothetical protein